MMTYEKADREARIFVNGLRKAQVPDDHPMAGQWIPASGEWGPQFRGHPLVRQAEAEGWGRDLRQHCIRVVRRQMFVKQDHSDIDKIMPDDKSIEHWRKQAARVRAADERLRVLAARVVSGLDRPAVFRARGQQSAAAGLVRAHGPSVGARSLLPLCLLQYRQLPGAIVLSGAA